MKTHKRLMLVAFFTISAIVILVQSCVKKTIDLDNMGDEQWQPNLAAPLIFSSLTIDDIITKSGKQGSILIGSDKFCTLVYRGTLFSFLAKDIIVLPPQTYTQTVNLTGANITALTGSGTVTVNYTQTINFDSGVGSPEVDSLIYKSGILTDSIVSDFKHNASITITIPSAKKAGVPFSQTLNLNYTGTTPVVATDNLNLNGYKFDMTDGGTTFSKFKINYAVTLNYIGGNPVTSTDKVTIIQKCANPTFDKVFGYIGTQSLVPTSQDKDTVALSIFRNTISGGTFTLDDARIKFIFSNSFGVPIKATMPQLIGYTPPGSNYPLTGTGIPAVLPIQSPTISQIGQIKVDSSMILSKSNSNILSVVSNSPQNIIYQITSQSNPVPYASRNFVIDTSRFKVDMEAQLPLYGTATNFTISDTIKDFKLSLTGTDATLETLMLRTYISNGFPTDVGVQVYFTDTLYNKIDSLISPYQVIVPSAVVNSTTGKVISPAVKTTDSNFDKTRIDNLTKAKRALVKGVVSTYNNGGTSVKIYSDYKLDIKIGVQAKLNVKINN